VDWKIYKEGQGKWARNTVASVVGLLGLYAVVSFYEWLPDPTSAFEMKGFWLESLLGVSDWPFDYRFVFILPLLALVAYIGIWQYNKPRWAEFLIDTENELKNRVTWPTRKEVVTNSIVVVVAVLIIGAYISVIDLCLIFAQERLYGLVD
jgi:preprotein translocase subunit SecE